MLVRENLVKQAAMNLKQRSCEDTLRDPYAATASIEMNYSVGYSICY